MNKKNQSQIGEPAAQWPTLTVARTQSESEYIFQRIRNLEGVGKWIFDAGDQDLCDRRACTLTTVVANFLVNAQKEWPGRSKPAIYLKHYRSLADHLSELHDKLAADMLPAMQGYATNVRKAAETARQCAALFEGQGKADFLLSQWTRSLRGNHKARNDFAISLRDWLQQVGNTKFHLLTAEITNAIFDGDTEQLDAGVVQRLNRK